jgi:uncharacterized membrane protein YfcA
MSTYLIICLLALVGSLLTFFSGFGLGTLLVPVFAIFFPIDLSIALTAIVHFLNNIFKLFLIGKNLNKKIVLQFGIPAIISSFAGAYLLNFIADVKPITVYTISAETFYITPLKLLVAALLLGFSLLELFPNQIKFEFNSKWIPLGGLLSGFFGGLSGHQGALRTAFLNKAGLSKEAFIATGVAVAVLVDVSRLTIYSGKILDNTKSIDYNLLFCATACAFAGAFIGNKLLRKITIKTLQTIVGIMLILFSVLLALGII